MRYIPPKTSVLTNEVLQQSVDTANQDFRVFHSMNNRIVFLCIGKCLSSIYSTSQEIHTRFILCCVCYGLVQVDFTHSFRVLHGQQGNIMIVFDRVWLHLCQRSNPEEYGYIDHISSTQWHSVAHYGGDRNSTSVRHPRWRKEVEVPPPPQWAIDDLSILLTPIHRELTIKPHQNKAHQKPEFILWDKP